MITISDKQIDVIVAKAFKQAVEKWQGKEHEFRPLSAVQKALGLISDADCLAAARQRSFATVVGNQLQKLVSLVAQQNREMFEVSNNEKPNGQVTDTVLISDKQTFLLFVQATDHTKNHDGVETIKRKMRKRDGHKGIQAIFEGKPRRRKIAENLILLQGRDLFIFISSTDSEFSNGDPTLYDRLLAGIERFGKAI